MLKGFSSFTVQHEGPGSFCTEFACCPHACVCSLQLLQLPYNEIRLVGRGNGWIYNIILISHCLTLNQTNLLLMFGYNC